MVALWEESRRAARASIERGTIAAGAAIVQMGAPGAMQGKLAAGVSDCIVFLDFDGVLNTADFLREIGAAHVGDAWLEPGRVRLVAELARRTGARVVLSTSWRYSFAQEELEAMLRRRGFDGAFAGATPKVVRARGEEIQAWFAAHGGETTRWVVLDDATDGMDWLGERHVRTTMEDGLTREHVEKAARLLGE